MGEARERTNRDMLRARDAIDRTTRRRSTSRPWPRSPTSPRALHPHVPVRLRRDAAPVPAAPPHRARDVPAPPTERSVTDVCLRRRLHQPRRRSAAPFRAIVGQSPSGYRAVAGRRPSRSRAVRDGLDASAPNASVDFERSGRHRTTTSVASMNFSCTSPLIGIYVLDQDEALDFYVGKLGIEVARDVDLGCHALAHGPRARRRRADPARAPGPARARRGHGGPRSATW